MGESGPGGRPICSVPGGGFCGKTRQHVETARPGPDPPAPRRPAPRPLEVEGHAPRGFGVAAASGGGTAGAALPLRGSDCGGVAATKADLLAQHQVSTARSSTPSSILRSPHGGPSAQGTLARGSHRCEISVEAECGERRSRPISRVCRSRHQRAARFPQDRWARPRSFVQQQQRRGSGGQARGADRGCAGSPKRQVADQVGQADTLDAKAPPPIARNGCNRRSCVARGAGCRPTSRSGISEGSW